MTRPSQCGMRLLEVMSQMRGSNASVALVLPDDRGGLAHRVQGVIGKDQILDSMADVTELFCG